jgi:cysteinyl-tRNA synthetase
MTASMMKKAVIAALVSISAANGAFVPSHNTFRIDTKTKPKHCSASLIQLKASLQDDGQPPQLKLYNSLTRTKDPVVPIHPPKISMYTCGPTVYDSAHVGNFRAFLTYDILKRVLLYLGYDVDHVCNLTDVDDKIIKRCTEQNVSLKELTTKYEDLFFQDLDALNIVKADHYPRATDHIDEMARLILDLEKNGLAYQSEEGSWYFSVDKKEGYGTKLVQLDPKEMQKTGMAGSQRGLMDADEYDSEKEGVRDFCLWKAYKPEFDREDATWDPVVDFGGSKRNIGRGRPGWHLECSAMARKYLGSTIDLHAGGIDLKFPHHENEIAQSEGANCAPFCNCWVHNGFVNIGDEKMSKSKGNFLTLRTACPTADDVRAYRYLVVSSQYRNPLSFTEKALNAAKGALKRLDKVKLQIDEALASATDIADTSSSEIATIVEKELQNFDIAIADDLSMPRASASLFSVVKAAENEFKRVAKGKDDNNSLDLIGLKRVSQALQQMDRVFGVYYDVPRIDDQNDEEPQSETVPDEVMELVLQRSAAKDTKDWDLADSLRSKIAALGFAVKDVKDGDPIVTKV